MNIWNNNLSTAPRGKMVPAQVRTKDGFKQIEQYQKEKILAVNSAHEVVSTYWIPPRYTASGNVLEGNRWSGFNAGDEPLAWAPWPVYVPPSHTNTDAGVQDECAIHPANHFILDDVGGQ
ncbi:hypothetical protein CYG48_04880 [Neorhizobium sp. SOG26]|uniref:hypothetical protein n=1 Tax=Neorhizobium sp. SOG26 TaxID=2060726 RepID=UPI000E590115|nr:hypothetical protein [Neorhizobium sp. SOG26]AXV15091.1 hypothetical protein CYG48_04880 [Neorhizobium sp. SOG26]